MMISLFRSMFRGRIFATLILLSAPFSLSAANAAFLTLPGETHLMGGGADPAFFSYDTATETFAATGANSEIVDRPLFDVVVGDLTGTFSLSAQIDSSGMFTGGSFLWTGGSAALGIGAGETLMTGTLGLFNIAPFVYQFLGSVDSINPLLEAEIGSIQSMLWEVAYFATCNPDTIDDNFTCDYTDSGGTPEAFVVHLSPNAIPEPSVLSLLLLGLAGVVVAGRKARAQ